ncbi:MAG: hypothetical protein ACLVB0_10740 [Fusicatenibacter saccharivorans]
MAFGYDLPDDRFRQPYMAKKVLVTFEAEVPALGYRTYYLETAEQATERGRSFRVTQMCLKMMQ